MRTTDGLPDDRVVCSTCTHFDGGSYRCRALRMSALADVPLRCVTYQPIRSQVDQRPGKERWPTLAADIDSARRATAAGAK